MQSKNSLTQQLNLFVQSQKESLIKAGEAISKADWTFFSTICDKITNSRVVAGLRNLFSTDTTAWNRFEKMYEARNLPAAGVLGFTGGLLLAGAGGSILLNAIGIALILYALSLLFAPLLTKLNSLMDQITAAALN